jgi:hypothetical protein
VAPWLRPRRRRVRSGGGSSSAPPVRSAGAASPPVIWRFCPARNGSDDVLEFEAHLGEPVGGAGRHDLHDGPGHKLQRLETIETLGERGWAATADGAAELVEAHWPGEEGPDDVHVPLLLEKLDGLEARAGGGVVHGLGDAASSDETGAGDAAEPAGLLEFSERGNGVGIAEIAGVVVVDGPAGGVVHPPGCFERDAVRVGEIDRADAAMVDDVSDFAVGASQAPLQVDERVFVGGG